MHETSVVKDVCLVGGGHSHALLLRRWAMQPLPGVRLTLVSSDTQTPYSGMLPGLIAGHYAYDDIHIDLLRLCQWAGVRFIPEPMVSLDLIDKRVCFKQRPPVVFDVLSLDTGSTPDLSIPGASESVTPVKPVSEFYRRWQTVCQRAGQAATSRFLQAGVAQVGEDASARKSVNNLQPHSSDVRPADNSPRLQIGVVGAGAGGFELVTAMRHALAGNAVLHWVLRGSRPMSDRASSVARYAEEAANNAGIVIHRHFDVSRVEEGCLRAHDGRQLKLDEILWCTGAVGPGWVSRSGLETDRRGFVLSNACLQSVSHPFVFATGDVGTQQHTPSGKAGVFAVRQAPYLFDNIRAFLTGQPLKPYTPQKQFLSLMATGDKQAIANRGFMTLRGRWVWRWKDHIDQSFMNRFRSLPVLRMNPALNRVPDVLRQAHTETIPAMPALSEYQYRKGPMLCRGCGSKVGEQHLQQALEGIQPELRADDDMLVSPAADTAVLHLPNRVLIQSVDQITAFIDDPWLFARIATIHALSDVATLDASVHSVQVLVGVPLASAAVVQRDLRLIMQGVAREVQSLGAVVAGGHTFLSPVMSLGLVVNATARTAVSTQGKSPGDTLFAANHQPHVSLQPQSGDVLILTKGVGTGVLFAALMQHKADGRDIVKAVESMLLSNLCAADILRHYGSRAMTDVTGFGLAGHLRRLLDGLALAQEGPQTTSEGRRSLSGASLVLSDVPILGGAEALSQSGVVSSLWSENRQRLQEVHIDADCDAARLALLCDPQTSGGLLSIVPQAQSRLCVEALHQAGYLQAAAIGCINDSGRINVVRK